MFIRAKPFGVFILNRAQVAENISHHSGQHPSFITLPVVAHHRLAAKIQHD